MIASAASLLALALLSTGSERFRGVARLADGRVAYVEEHEVELRDGRVARAETRYLDAAGRPLARLGSAYGSSPWAPDYDFVDLRTGASEWVRRSGEGIELGGNGRRRLLVPPGDRPLVAGQGLDRFIRAHLDRLERGERLAVLLALPGRLAVYDFRLRAEPSPEQPPEPQGRLLRVHVEPSGLLLRLLAPAIVADYDPATGRLVRYRGVSNLSGPDGSTQEVEIAYADADSTRS